MKVMILVLTSLVALSRQQSSTSLTNAFGAVFANSANAFSNAANPVNVPVVNTGAPGNTPNLFGSFVNTAFRPQRGSFFAIRPISPLSQPAAARPAAPAPVPARPTPVPARPAPVPARPASTPAGTTRVRRSMADNKKADVSPPYTYNWPTTGWLYG